MLINRRGALIIAIALLATACGKPAPGGAGASVKLLNVSYDPTRELYEEVNGAFAKSWKAKTGQDVTIAQSHGGSGKQARAVMDGLEADVVTLALAFDVDAIAETGRVAPGWQDRFPDKASPFTSTIVLVVRKGNPKGIKDWDDLARPGIQVVTPNPKTSGGARWNYLAAWGFELRRSKDEAKAKELVKKIYANVQVLDSGARGSTTTFLERGMGDVLVAWENEAILATTKLAKDEVEIVVPSASILAETPVALVDKVVDKRGTREIAKAYLDFLWTDEGQRIAARSFYRPRKAAILAENDKVFPKLDLFTVDDVFGGWQKAQKTHFSDGGVFDQIHGGQ